MEDRTVVASVQPNASLVVQQGAQMGMTFPLTGGIATLGRKEGLEVPLQDPEVSRQHARISWQTGGYILEDLGSTNGTYLNGVQITSSQPLRTGDMVGLGQTVLMFQQMEVAPDQLTATPMPSAEPAPPLYSHIAEPSKQQTGRSRCLLWGCGCLILAALLLAVVAVGAMVLFAQEIQPIFDDLGIPIQLTMLYATQLLA